MAKFEQQVRRDPQSHSLATGAGDGCVAKAKNSRKAARICSLFPAFSPPAEAAREQTKVMAHWPLWRLTTALATARAVFLVREPEKKGKRQKAKVKRQKYCGGGRRRTSFESPASCRLGANVEGRGAAGLEAMFLKFRIKRPWYLSVVTLTDGIATCYC